MPEASEGKYEVQFNQAVLKYDEKDGEKRNYFELEFEVPDLGKRRWIKLWLHRPGSAKRAKWVLHELGFNRDFQEPVFEKMVDTMHCVHEEYNGEMQEQWKFPFEGDEAQKVEDPVKFGKAFYKDDEADDSDKAKADLDDPGSVPF